MNGKFTFLKEDGSVIRTGKQRPRQKVLSVGSFIALPSPSPDSDIWKVINVDQLGENVTYVVTPHDEPLMPPPVDPEE